KLQNMASRRPAPRTPLSRERIVEAALALIHDEGLGAFSTRKLGSRLHVEAMSIYHHFPSKQHLLDALVEHAIAAVDVPERGPNRFRTSSSVPTARISSTARRSSRRGTGTRLSSSALRH